MAVLQSCLDPWLHGVFKVLKKHRFPLCYRSAPRRDWWSHCQGWLDSHTSSNCIVSRLNISNKSNVTRFVPRCYGAHVSWARLLFFALPSLPFQSLPAPDCDHVFTTFLTGERPILPKATMDFCTCSFTWYWKACWWKLQLCNAAKSNGTRPNWCERCFPKAPAGPMNV